MGTNLKVVWPEFYIKSDFHIFCNEILVTKIKTWHRFFGLLGSVCPTVDPIDHGYDKKVKASR